MSFSTTSTGKPSRIADRKSASVLRVRRRVVLPPSSAAMARSSFTILSSIVAPFGAGGDNGAILKENLVRVRGEAFRRSLVRNDLQSRHAQVVAAIVRHERQIVPKRS